MSVDERDLAKAREAALAKATAARQLHRQTLSHVAVKMEDVLNDDGWALYAKLLTEKRDVVQASLEALTAQILGDAVGDDLLKLKLTAADLRGQVTAFDVALGLTAQVRAQAVKEPAA